MMREEHAREVLGGALFDICFSFFEEVFSRKSEYKIILTRRCFSLYKIFAPILKEQGIENSNGVIITDNAIDIKMEEIRKALTNPPEEGVASVIIVDDIIIYGRTLNAILDKIFDKDSKEIRDNLRIMSIVKSVQNCLNEEYSNLILARHIASSIEWKKYSYAFSKLIKSSETANTSYIVSAEMSQDSVTEEFIRFCETDMCCTTTKELHDNSVESYVIAAELPESTLNRYKLPKETCSFVRVYFYKKLGTIVFSPLLIIDALSAEAMNNITAIMANTLCGNADSLKSLLSNVNEQLGLYKMRLLTLLLSHILLRDFMTAKNIQFSFDSSDFKTIVQYNFPDLLLSDFEQFDSNISNTTDNLGNLFNYTSEDINTKDEELEDFVFDKAMSDNNSVETNKFSRQKGFNRMNGKPLFVKEHIAGLMVLIDNGLAALKAEFYSSEDNCFVSFMYPGEQALRVMSNKCEKSLPTMYALENFSNMYNLNCYELYRRFSEVLYEGRFQTEDEKNIFLQYVDILQKNNQQISDVMCVDYTHISREDIDKSFVLLNKFEREVLKK